MTQITVQNNTIVVRGGKIGTSSACCCGGDGGSPCVNGHQPNGCAYYVSARGLDTYDYRCSPSHGTGLVATSSAAPWATRETGTPGQAGYESVSLGYGFGDSAGFGSQADNGWIIAGTRIAGGRVRLESGNGKYEIYAFALTTTSTGANGSLLNPWFISGYIEKEFRPYKWLSGLLRDLTEEPAVIQPAKDEYNECELILCRHRLPNPFVVSVGNSGITANGKLIPWQYSAPSEPASSETIVTGSIEFTVTQRDCCYKCASGNSNVCCNPLP